MVSSISLFGAIAIDRYDDTESRAGMAARTAALAARAARQANFSFATAALPANGRFETWRDLFARRLVAVEVFTDDAGAFDSRVEMWEAGPLSIAGITTTNAREMQFVRTTSQVRNGDDDFSLTLCKHSVSVRSLRDDELHVPQGGAFFLRHDRRFSVETPPTVASYLLRIDRKALLELVPRNFDPNVTGFAPGVRTLDLIWRYLPLIVGDAENGSRQSRARLGGHIVDLVALMLKPSGDALEMVRGRGLKAARTKALLDAIDRHFATNDLTPATVGHHLGISARQVHRLLEETPKTFEEHVLERRLQHAYKLLTEPGRGPSRIADIALASGFAGATQFNRAFRARFGDTPTGVRSTAAREDTLRVQRESVKGAR